MKIVQADRAPYVERVRLSWRVFNPTGKYLGFWQYYWTPWGANRRLKQLLEEKERNESRWVF